MFNECVDFEKRGPPGSIGSALVQKIFLPFSYSSCVFVYSPRSFFFGQPISSPVPPFYYGESRPYGAALHAKKSIEPPKSPSSYDPQKPGGSSPSPPSLHCRNWGSTPNNFCQTKFCRSALFLYNAYKALFWAARLDWETFLLCSQQSLPPTESGPLP